MKAAPCRFHDQEARTRSDFWRIDRSRLEFQSAIVQDNNVSEVWKASLFDPMTARMHDVAVKYFPLEQGCCSACEKISHEIDLLCLAATRCQHVCKCYGWSSDEKGVYIVMKLYAASVCSRMREHPNGKLPFHVVKKYGKQLCAALIELHEQGIVMADLKPANFLLDDLDNLVVSDFGISTLQDTALERGDDGVYGTFNYMSPEAFDAEAFGKLSAKSDAWAFACCMIEMLTGTTPWVGKAMSAICFKVTQTTERPSVPEELPRALQQALQRCFASDPAERPSFRQLLEALEGWEEAPPPLNLAQLQHLEGRESYYSLASSSRRSMAEESSVASLKEEKEALKGQVRKLREKLLSTQEVSRILREQLYVVVGTLKEQQHAPARAHCKLCSEQQVQRVELEGQLHQCRKQKDVAKAMLAQEAARSSRLAADLAALHAARRHSSLSKSHPRPLLISNATADAVESCASTGDRGGEQGECMELRRSDLDSQASTPALSSLSGSARSVTSVPEWPQASSVPA